MSLIQQGPDGVLKLRIFHPSRNVLCQLSMTLKVHGQRSDLRMNKQMRLQTTSPQVSRHITLQLLTLRLAWRGIAARGGAPLLPSLSLANGERLTCSWSKVGGRIGGLGLWLGLLLVVVSLPAHSLHWQRSLLCSSGPTS